LCVITGTITNVSGDPLQIDRIIFFLESKNGATLADMRTYLSLKFEKGAGEERNFDIKEYVPSGILPQFHHMGAGLSFKRE